MSKKIIYFTASSSPTAGEVADIAALNAMAGPEYVVNVSNGAVDSGLGKIESSDYVAGTVPGDYSAVGVFSIANPPRPASLPSNQAVVFDAQAINVENSAGALDSPATAVVGAGVLTSVKLGDTKSIVTQGDTINVENSAGALDSPATATVALGVVTGVQLSATKTIVTHGQAIVIGPTTYTFTVVGGVITAIATV